MVFHRVNFQFCLTCRMTDQVDDDIQTLQRLSLPVHRNVVEQSVFNLVPLTRAQRKVTHGNRQITFICKLLQTLFRNRSRTSRRFHAKTLRRASPQRSRYSGQTILVTVHELLHEIQISGLPVPHILYVVALSDFIVYTTCIF